jgi:hypothetical protein
MIIDLGDRLNWDVVDRATYTAADILTGIAPKTYSIDTPGLIVGIKCPSGRDNWRYAGQLIQYVQAYPTSYQPAFFPITEVSRHRLYLNRYRYIELADHEPREYTIQLQFPIWFGDVLVELFKYTP